MTEKPITVLLIDDHPVVRNGYRRLLESTADIHVVADADNGETGCTLHQEHKPDVTIISLLYMLNTRIFAAGFFVLIR